MAKITLTQAQRFLLGIISSVEAGYTSPSNAVGELELLKKNAAESGVKFNAEYTLGDFEDIRARYTETYELSQEFESSESY